MREKFYAKIAEQVQFLGFPVYVGVVAAPLDRVPALYIVEQEHVTELDQQAVNFIHTVTASVEVFFRPKTREVRKDLYIIKTPVEEAFDLLERLEQQLFGKAWADFIDPVFEWESDFHILDGNVLHVGLTFKTTYRSQKGCS